MIILLIYLFSMSGFVKSNENSDLSNRFLPSWSSYTSWSSCNNDYYWTFLNNSCVSTSSSTVASDSYSFNTESAYCSSYVSSGVIYLNSTGSNSVYFLSTVWSKHFRTPYMLLENNESITNTNLFKISKDSLRLWRYICSL